MFSSMVATGPWALWAFLPLLNFVAAQSTNPSNDTTSAASQFPAPGTPQLILRTTQTTSMSTQVNIDPLTQPAGQQNSVQQLSQLQIVGHLVLVDENSASSVTDGDIAFVSCDPSAYSGNNVVADTINVVSSKAPNAIVLYSTYSIYCTFDSTNGYDYNFVYTTTSPNASTTVKASLTQSGPTMPQTTIMLDQSSLGKNGTGAPLGPSPTTAVAMIILYSITGIITALFLIIIITGAIRAHRHPERYGPRQLIGRPRQSRAKGIARAMLETLPIVKFGELDGQNKTVSQAGDIELGEHGNPSHTQNPPDTNHQISGVIEQSSNEESGKGRDLVRTITAEGVEPSAEPKEETNDISKTDNGLACSVCTDDFVKGQDIRVLPCQHKFHPECIDPWLLNVSGTCPLCRVDLRPTTSNADHDHLEEGSSISPNAYMTDAAPITEANAADQGPIHDPEATNASRRRSNGLSLYLHHTLNIRRMRDATPEERIAALRRIRTANRANETEPGQGLAVGERTRNRVAAGFGRVFRRPSAQATNDSETMETPSRAAN